MDKVLQRTEQAEPGSAFLEYLDEQTLKIFPLGANHGDIIIDLMCVLGCPKKLWICHCHLLWLKTSKNDHSNALSLTSMCLSTSQKMSFHSQNCLFLSWNYSCVFQKSPFVFWAFRMVETSKIFWSLQHQTHVGKGVTGGSIYLTLLCFSK